MTQTQKSRTKDQYSQTPSARLLSNTEIADRLASLAQLLLAQKENPYKVRAYQRAAARIRQLSESLDEDGMGGRGFDSIRWGRRSNR